MKKHGKCPIQNQGKWPKDKSEKKSWPIREARSSEVYSEGVERGKKTQGSPPVMGIEEKSSSQTPRGGTLEGGRMQLASGGR